LNGKEVISDEEKSFVISMMLVLVITVWGCATRGDLQKVQSQEMLTSAKADQAAKDAQAAKAAADAATLKAEAAAAQAENAVKAAEERRRSQRKKRRLQRKRRRGLRRLSRNQ